MNDNLQKIFGEYVENLKAIYKGSLSAVILYGSYARGDYINYTLLLQNVT